MGKLYSETELQQGSKQWLDWRRGGIEANDIVVLASYAEVLEIAIPDALAPTLSGHKIPSWLSTPLELFNRKVNGVQNSTEAPATVDMARGKKLEPRVRAGANEVFRANFVPVCIEDGLYRVSLDGLDVRRKAMLGITAPRKLWEGVVPRHHRLMMIYQRAVLERSGVLKDARIKSMGVAAGYEQELCTKYAKDGVSFDTFPIPYDSQLGEWLLHVAESFWSRYVLPRVAPPVVAADVHVHKDAAWKAAAEAYRRLYDKAGEIGAQMTKARQKLLDLVGEDECVHEGFGVRVSTYQKEGGTTKQVTVLKDQPAAPRK